jgi:hypothetical protein
MNRKRITVVAIVALVLASGVAISAQDKYTLQVPNGLAFADFRGYEDWQLVSLSETDDRLKAIVANPTMIAAYRAGIPGNGKKFPDGSKIAKIQWKPKKSTDAQFSVNVPDTLADIFFMERDSKRFPDSGGWGYAQIDYDPKLNTFAPNKAGTKNCGQTCHTRVVANDYIFHPFQKR